MIDLIMKVLLASNSPRRRELLALLDVDFDIVVPREINEVYPCSLSPDEVAPYLSRMKSQAYSDLIHDGNVLLTADTVVILGERILGKPIDREDAIDMLRALSGCSHKVVTGVTLSSQSIIRTFSETTHVKFATLTDAEIEHYVDKYKPFDKAGAYGIQEWIGFIGIESIEGDYYNVMGLPVQRVYKELKKINPQLY